MKKSILTVVLALVALSVSAQKITRFNSPYCIDQWTLYFSVGDANYDQATARESFAYVIVKEDADLSKLDLQPVYETTSSYKTELVNSTTFPTDFSNPLAYFGKNLGVFTRKQLPDGTGPWSSSANKEHWYTTCLLVQKLIPADLPLEVKTIYSAPGYASTAEIGGGYTNPYMIQLHTNGQAIYFAFTSSADKINFQIEHSGAVGSSEPNGKVLVESSSDLTVWNQVAEIKTDVEVLAAATKVNYSFPVGDLSARYIRLRMTGLATSRNMRKLVFRNMSISKLTIPLSFDEMVNYHQVRWSLNNPNTKETAALGGIYAIASPMSSDPSNLNVKVDWGMDQGYSYKLVDPTTLPTDFSSPRVFYTQLFEGPLPMNYWRKTEVVINKVTQADLPLIVANTGIGQSGYAFAGERLTSSGGEIYTTQLHTNNNALYVGFNGTAKVIRFQIEHLGTAVVNENAKIMVEESADFRQWSSAGFVLMQPISSPVVFTEEEFALKPETRYVRLRVTGLTDSRTSRKANPRNLRVLRDGDDDPTSMDCLTQTSDAISISKSNGELRIESSNGESLQRVEIYNLNGIRLATYNTGASSYTLPAFAVPVLIRIFTANGTFGRVVY